MKSLVLGALALVLSCASASANALHLNPAQPDHTPNMQTFGETTIPVGYYEFCRRDATECTRPSVSAWVELTRKRWKQMIEINNQVNASVSR